MKAGTAGPEAATALTLTTAPAAAVGGGTAFMSAVAAYPGTTGDWRTRVVQDGKVPHASARVLTVNDVSLCETASGHTGIQVDSDPFTQKGAVRTFVEHGMTFKYGGPTVHDSPELSCQVPTDRLTMICTAGVKSHYPGRRPHQPLHRLVPRPANGLRQDATHLGWASPIWGFGLAVGAASGRSVRRRRRGEHPGTAAPGRP